MCSLHPRRSAENAQESPRLGGVLPRYSVADPTQRSRWVLRLLALLYLMIFVSVVISMLRSPSIRIRSPYELDAVELVAISATLIGLTVLALQIAYELLELSRQ